MSKYTRLTKELHKKDMYFASASFLRIHEASSSICKCAWVFFFFNHDDCVQFGYQGLDAILQVNGGFLSTTKERTDLNKIPLQR